jgi:hypothetical protein
VFSNGFLSKIGIKSDADKKSPPGSRRGREGDLQSKRLRIHTQRRLFTLVASLNCRDRETAWLP